MQRFVKNITVDLNKTSQYPIIRHIRVRTERVLL